MSKADQSIIVQRISKLINYVSDPEELADKLDELQYFNNKRIENQKPTSKQTNKQTGQETLVRN